MSDGYGMETRVARLEEKVDSHEGDIRRIMPMFVEVAENRVRMEQMHQQLTQAISDLREFRTQMDQRDDDQRKERKKDRWALIATVLTTGGLIVSAIALLVPIG